MTVEPKKFKIRFRKCVFGRARVRDAGLPSHPKIKKRSARGFSSALLMVRSGHPCLCPSQTQAKQRTVHSTPGQLSHDHYDARWTLCQNDGRLCDARHDEPQGQQRRRQCRWWSASWNALPLGGATDEWGSSSGTQGRWFVEGLVWLQRNECMHACILQWLTAAFFRFSI